MAPVASESTQMTLPMTDLHKLPQRLELSQRRGRASIVLQRLRDTLFIQAHCDSLERMLEELSLEDERSHNEQRRLRHTQRELSLNTPTPHSLGRYPPYGFCCLGFIFALLLERINPYHRAVNRLIKSLKTLFI